MIDTKQIFKNQKVLIVVPTYNNAGTIGRVITELKEYANDILVVNDGSTDGTLAIIQQSGVEYITYNKNMGKGYAIRQSFKYAVKIGCHYVLTIDSDGQHYASDLSLFAESILKFPDSLIIGARNLKADNMPSKNTFANKFSNFWYRVETGNLLEDTQSGYRVYPLRKMGRVSFLSNRYEFEVEVIVRSAWKGIEVLNMPIHVYYPPQEERISHFKPLKDFTRISILNSILVIVALLYYYPWKFLHSLTRENIKQFMRANITETKESNYKVAASIGLGIFFGIVPLWGYQMIAAGITSHFLKLNKVLTIICSNISIPPMIPFILYGSFYTGGVLLERDSDITLSSISFENVYNDLVQYLYGAVVFAVVCGIATYIVARCSLLIFRRNTNG